MIDRPEGDGLDFQGGDVETPGTGQFEGEGPGSRALELTEVAFDADWEFYQSNLNHIDWTVTDIEDVLNNVEVIYQRDVEICYNITHIIVRTDSNDP